MKRQTKQNKTGKLWLRSLADFSLRNPLLCFKGKNAIPLLAPDLDELVQSLSGEGLKLIGSAEGEPLVYEAERCVFTPLLESEALSLAHQLKRKDAQSLEETGAKILFLACGFLRFGKECFAPILLAPAQLNKARGEGFTLSLLGEPFVNATLIEYLLQEFRLDLKCLDDAPRSPHEVFQILRRETADMPGWEVTEEAYLGAFFFQRFLMWNDLKEHFDEFLKNDNVRALANDKTLSVAPMSAVEPHLQASENTDGAPMSALGPVTAVPSVSERIPSPEDMVLPLPSDASQRAAVHLSASGKSCVLHGPPGTGKSQTITNMIAYALERGKSVLFVAGKRAALEIVKRRLHEIGIGDFCLDIKSDQADAFKQLRRTLHLTPKKEGAADEEYALVRRSLQANEDALHKKRKLGLSVHEAILGYFAHRDYPDVLKIGGDFYESLSEEKLSECRALILLAATAARECGGVFNSPFENVNLKEYSLAVRDRALLAAKALLGESAHLKCFLSLTLDFFKQKISSFTAQRAERLAKLFKGLLAGKYDKYFKGVTLEEFLSFRGANLRLEHNLAFYAGHFKVLVNIENEYEELQAFVRGGGSVSFSRAVLALKKRLERVALHSLAQEDIPKYIEAVVNIFAARRQIAASPLGKSFVERSGHLSPKKRQAFLAPLKELNELAASVFSEFAPERFFEGCIRAANGCANPVFEGYLASVKSFLGAIALYEESTQAERGRAEGEDILGYYSAKAAALIDNSDLLRARCDYNAAVERLKEQGMQFIGDALRSGALTPDNVLGGFEKSLLEHFLSANLATDPYLSRMTSGGLASEAEGFALLAKRQQAHKREQLKYALTRRLPQEGELRQELALFHRLERRNGRGRLRGLFLNAPELVKRVCPCLLLSPDEAAQFLVPRADEYDLVIFDEASQMTTPEAVCALARAKQAIIVGDNRQLPPTPFFRTTFSEEDEDDLESVLDAALAAGFQERSLVWHYRSCHESLIAFSNATYYDNRLNVFPSPTAGESRVHLYKVEGTYERGGSKRNRGEAAALVQEIIRRLSDPVLKQKSMGVVTFSTAQRDEIERLLSQEIAKHSLQEAAYGREPLFVKNLENVQGDERDVILFSVCYGFDKEQKLFYNFGALNRAGGWRRLNVACSRAREEMLVFSSITASDINLNRTSTKGMVGLKAFLEFAERGKCEFGLPAALPANSVGQHLARELTACGYAANAGMGTGNFKIDVAVLDPRDKSKYILGILFSGEHGSAADNALLLPEMLKKGGWNILRVSEVSYFNNPKREVKRIKDCLDALTGTRQSPLMRYQKPYRCVRGNGGKTAALITDGRHKQEIIERLRAIVIREQPISRAFLKKRCMENFGIAHWGAQVEEALDMLITRASFPCQRVGGTEYFYQSPKALQPDKFRREGRFKRRKEAEDFTPFETAALIKGILEEEVTLYEDELVSMVCAVYEVKETEAFAAFVNRAAAYGEERGMFRRFESGRISLRNDCKDEREML